MKKIILLALFVAPLFAAAQTKNTTVSPDKSTAPPPVGNYTAKEPVGRSKYAVFNPETFFIELIMMDMTNGVNIRVDYGRELLTGITDKELVAQLTDLRTAGFNNVPDAMNYLTNIGFRYLDNYTLNVNNKSEMHLIFERHLTKKGGNGVQTTTERPVAPTPPKGEKPLAPVKPSQK